MALPVRKSAFFVSYLWFVRAGFLASSGSLKLRTGRNLLVEPQTWVRVWELRPCRAKSRGQILSVKWPKRKCMSCGGFG